MMLKQKIKLMTDTCSDIPSDLAQKYDILMLCFPVTVDGVSYREVQDFTKEEFYDMLAKAQEFPTTAQLTPFELHETYVSLYQQGYTDVIFVTIASGGSATYRNAFLAKQQFEEEDMEADRPMHIHIVDSRNYTATYGYAVVEAAKKLQRGAGVPELLDYLEDWMASASLYFVPMSLKILKRSGRVSAAAAFAGELLGLRPLVQMTDCKSYIVEKVRGEQNIVPHLGALAKERMIPHTPYMVLYGGECEYGETLSAYMTKLIGYPPEDMWAIGATISCNAGSHAYGFVIKQENRGAMPTEEQ